MKVSREQAERNREKVVDAASRLFRARGVEGVGIGAALMRRALGAAQEAGETLVLLVGDEPYYRRFGFAVIPEGQLILPGPVDPKRFLGLELADGALARARGPVRARQDNQP
jgi:predicted N-acetyltransferase YhbS